MCLSLVRGLVSLWGPPRFFVVAPLSLRSCLCFPACSSPSSVMRSRARRVSLLSFRKGGIGGETFHAKTLPARFRNPRGQRCRTSTRGDSSAEASGSRDCRSHAGCLVRSGERFPRVAITFALFFVHVRSSLYFESVSPHLLSTIVHSSVPRLAGKPRRRLVPSKHPEALILQASSLSFGIRMSQPGSITSSTSVPSPR